MYKFLVQHNWFLGGTQNRIYQIISEERSITADTAMRLGIFFSNSPEFWLNLQQAYELDIVRQSSTNFQHIQPYAPM